MPDRKCEQGWLAVWGRGLFWIDEEHIATSQTYVCRSPGSRPAYSTELSVLDMNAAVSNRSRGIDSISRIRSGLPGSLLVTEGDFVNVLDNRLQVKQTLPCPIQGKPCVIYRSNSTDSDSDFVICSISKNENDCGFYRGLPYQKVSESKIVKASSKFVADDPYQDLAISGGSVPPHQGSVWKIASSELWYFDLFGTLSAIDSRGVTSRIAPENWENWRGESGCHGDLSSSEPRRFLVTCGGVYFYTDGDLDSIFGYAKIAVFDVSTRRLLARFSGRANTTAALSNSGKVVAIAHKKELRLYRVK
jgi:hypothetical protein